jgi:hypothetical protein
MTCLAALTIVFNQAKTSLRRLVNLLGVLTVRFVAVALVAVAPEITGCSVRGNPSNGKLSPGNCKQQ